MKLAFWKRKKNTDVVKDDELKHISKLFSYNELGITFSSSQNAKTDADFYWQSLEEEELAYLVDGHYVLPWEELFQILQDEEHKNVISLLNLPKQTSFRPVIKSEGGLSDSNFKIILDGWLNENNVKINPNRG